MSTLFPPRFVSPIFDEWQVCEVVHPIRGGGLLVRLLYTKSGGIRKAPDFMVIKPGCWIEVERPEWWDDVHIEGGLF